MKVNCGFLLVTRVKWKQSVYSIILHYSDYFYSFFLPFFVMWSFLSDICFHIQIQMILTAVLIRSLIYIRNSRVPNIEPWGMPNPIFESLDCLLLTVVNCCLFVKLSNFWTIHREYLCAFFWEFISREKFLYNLHFTFIDLAMLVVIHGLELYIFGGFLIKRSNRCMSV